jgi:5-(carboxyamino)imidazole ribonucleotide mutase
MTSDDTTPRIGVIMGSRSDYASVAPAVSLLEEFGVPHEVRVVSAHRTPTQMLEYARTAESRGLRVIIAAAGGAAHLPGMVAAATMLPVIGIPVPVTALQGMDALLSIVQMPAGVPVATVAIGKPGATNAALLALQILGTHDTALRARLQAWRDARTAAVLADPDPRADS